MGLMSRIATTCSFVKRTSAGISPATILQNTQLLIDNEGGLTKIIVENLFNFAPKVKTSTVLDSTQIPDYDDNGAAIRTSIT